MPSIKIAIASVDERPVDAGQLPVFLVGEDNSFTLALSYSGEQDLGLAGGAPVSPGADDGPTSLYLTFPADTFADFALISVTPPDGWAAQAFGQVWALAPKANVAWKPGDTLKVAVAKVRVVEHSDARLPVTLERTPLHDVHSPLTIVTQGSGADLRSVVDFGFDGMSATDDYGGARDSKEPEGRIFLGTAANKVSNTLLFHLSNKSPNESPNTTPLVASWPKDRRPTFTLSFVTAEPGDADAAGALTTRELLDSDAVSVAVVPLYQGKWKVLHTKGDLEWKLRPKFNNQEVLGTGAAAQFQISGIASFLPEGRTWAYLAYADVPGYANGFLAQSIYKENAAPSLHAWNTTPDVINGGDRVALAWQPFAVTGLRLTYLIHGLTYTKTSPQDFKVVDKPYAPAPAPIATTTYYLDAVDADGNVIKGLQQTVTITVNPRPAKINSFVCQPAGWVFQGNASVPVTLTWDVEHALEVQLTTPEKRDITVKPDENTWSGSITGPTTFHLQVFGEDGLPQPADVSIVDLRSVVAGKKYQFISRWNVHFWTLFSADGTGASWSEVDEVDDPGVKWLFTWVVSQDRVQFCDGHWPNRGVINPGKFEEWQLIDPFRFRNVFDVQSGDIGNVWDVMT